MEREGTEKCKALQSAWIRNVLYTTVGIRDTQSVMNCLDEA